MKYPLKNLIHEKLTEEKSIYDTDLLKDLQKSGQDISMEDLNNQLMSMEIMGLLTVRWASKDKRRLEIVEKQSRDT